MKYIKVVIVLTILIFLPWFVWIVKEEQQLNVTVLDKTIPEGDISEHKGLFWLLKNMKIVPGQGEIYNGETDYYGIIGKEQKLKPLPEDLSKTDLIYIADTYGTSNGSSSEEKKKSSGIAREEWTAIKRAIDKHDSTIIIEFDSLSAPTEKSIKEEASSLLGMRQTGWTGRYFQDLSIDAEKVPQWAIDTYEKDFGKKWSFTGKGLLFAKEETEKVAVLTENDGHLDGTNTLIEFTQAGKSHFNLTKSPTYNKWFDVVETAKRKEQVYAEYNLGFTEEGKKLAKDIGLPESFPAIINNNGHYYFSGDFTYVSEVPDRYKYAGYTKLHEWISNLDSSSDRAFFWKTYVPVMKKILSQIEDKHKSGIGKGEKNSFEKNADGLYYSSRIENRMFEVYRDGEWEPITAKGVNIGMGKPGAFPGEAAISRAEYDDWFEQIGEMNANMIRIYTLHPPAFYEALLEYNRTHDNKLYLLHGVWADEEPLEETLDAFTPEIVATFESEMKRVADVIHGQAVVEPKPGHASGSYNADISEYVVGWVLGIEWYPFMVDNMKKVHANKAQYEGKHIQTNDAEGFELWLAERMDNLMIYEEENYGWTRPISFTNWVTTDHLNQPAEPHEQENLASVNPDHIKFRHPEKEVGMFASYHVYPYYPDFLNLEEKYTGYIDHRGEKNNYAGYLHDLHSSTEIPILIAEFGIPASRGMSHENVWGLNQGFQSEKKQGELLVRLYDDIIYEGMMGGFIFAWQDEWFKKTWNTMELDDPDRRPFWSNVQTNEQSFGLLSFNSLKILIDGKVDDWEDIDPIYDSIDKSLERMYVTHDEAYLYLRADLKEGSGKWLEDVEANFLLDTLPGKGSISSELLEGVKLSEAKADFHISLTSKEDSHAFVESAYDTFLFQYGVQLKMIEYGGIDPVSGSGVFNPIRLVLNKRNIRPDTKEILPFSSYETGKLRYGNGNPESVTYDSLSDFIVSDDGRTIEVRLPWMLLNFKDPSTKKVMGDLYAGKGLESEEIINDIGVILALRQKNGEIEGVYPNAQSGYRYEWNSWNIPDIKERLKSSYWPVQKRFSEIE